MIRRCLLLAAVLVLLGAAFSCAIDPADYEVGGPLQGVKLAPFPTQHGEKPGQPGAVPELQKPDEKGNLLFTDEGMAPQMQLFPGSVEHFHCYWFKYLPVKSFFDRQSLLRNFLAKELAADRIEQYAEPVYWVPRHQDERNTGLFNAPVPVARWQAGAADLKLDCGELAPGLYAVRVIAAVEGKLLQRHRLPLILRLTVNDGLGGEVNAYQFRCKYVDEFYAVAEFYFHAPEKRHYQATLAIVAGSQVPLLLHNVELHDALAGSSDHAVKSRRTMTPPLPAAVAPLANDEARLQRDALLWQALTGPNSQTDQTIGGGGDDGKSNWPNFGAGGLSPEEIVAKHGQWKPAPLGPNLLVNEQLKLSYTVADLAAGKPLPDPYPFKDSGPGVFTAPANEGQLPQNWYPVAQGVQERFRAVVAGIINGSKLCVEKSDSAAGRDAAVLLCRLAYEFPGIDVSNALRGIVLQPGPYGRDLGSRRRDPRQGDPGVLIHYDQLFDLIANDKNLAESVGRFVPWVKTPQDVIRLLDGYLVQTVAKRILRYHMYYANEPALILTPAIIEGDTAVTDPWLDWLFSAGFVYPLPPSGIQDLLITGNDRNGIGYIASYSYALSEQAAPKAALLEQYIAAGGNRQYDLSDPLLYPKPLAACYWFLNSRIAGLNFLRIGDVAGPDKPYAAWFDSLRGQCLLGWKWSRDPRFAYVLAHYFQRNKETPEEWAQIEQAAQKQKRAPWMENRSRVLTNWAGVLEAGVQSDDLRCRTNVMVRSGQGWGHHHDDTLDLQLHAYGYPMTIDGGQRPGYSSPGDRSTRVHNLVEVDEKGWMGHSWINTLSDMEGAAYMSVEAAPTLGHENVKLYRRQVALLEVAPGQGGVNLSPAQAGPKPQLDPLVSQPLHYVFDVVRVAGGKVHTYCFHGPLEDQLETNALDKQPWEKLPQAEQEYLRFPQKEYSIGGNAPEVVQATWRMTRAANEPDGRAMGTERSVNAAIYDEKSPRKFTRLHLLATPEQRVLTGRLLCKQWTYGFTNLFVQQRAQSEGDCVFPAIIEAYVGEPFLAAPKLLTVANNENDARKAVAVAVHSAQGHDDICFADGRPERTRSVADLRIAGEFAYVSRDGSGLRQASLTGGTLLQGTDILLRPAAGERRGKIIAADYLHKTMIIDQRWSGPLAQRAFEIGVAGHMTTYTIAGVNPQDAGSALTVTEGADFYASRVNRIDAASNTVYCALAIPLQENKPCPGADKSWVASNEAMTKFWRADYLGGSDGQYAFRLQGESAKESDFGKSRGFRLWEYGVGDELRQSTLASLRRTEAGVYQLSADVAVEVGLVGTSLEISSDGLQWQPLAGKQAGKLMQAQISAEQLGAAGQCYLRVK